MAKKMDVTPESLVSKASEDTAIAAAKAELSKFLDKAENHWASPTGFADAKKILLNPDAAEVFRGLTDAGAAGLLPSANLIASSEFGSGSALFKKTVAMIAKGKPGSAAPSSGASWTAGSGLESDMKRIVGLAFEEILPELQTRLLKAESDRRAADLSKKTLKTAVIPGLPVTDDEKNRLNEWLEGVRNDDIGSLEPRFRAEKERQLFGDLVRNRNSAVKKFSMVLFWVQDRISSIPAGLDIDSYFDIAAISADPAARGALETFRKAAISSRSLEVSDFRALIPAFAHLKAGKGVEFAEKFLPAISVADAVSLGLMKEDEAKESVLLSIYDSLPELKKSSADSNSLKAMKSRLEESLFSGGSIYGHFNLAASQYASSGHDIKTVFGLLAVSYGKSFSEQLKKVRQKLEEGIGDETEDFIGTAETLISELKKDKVSSHLVYEYGNPAGKKLNFEKNDLIQLTRPDGSRFVFRIDSVHDGAADGYFTVSQLSSSDGKGVYRTPESGPDILSYQAIMESVRANGCGIQTVPAAQATKYFSDVGAQVRESSGAVDAEILDLAHLSQEIDAKDVDGKRYGLSVGTTFMVRKKGDVLENVTFRISAIDEATGMITIDGEAPVPFTLFHKVFLEKECQRIPEIKSSESFLARMDEKFRYANKSRAGDWSRFRFQEGVGIVTAISVTNNERYKNPDGKKKYSYLQDIVGGERNAGIRILRAEKDKVMFVKGTVKEGVKEEEKEKDGKKMKTSKATFDLKYEEKDIVCGTYADLFAAMRSIDAFQPRVPKEEHEHEPENEEDIHLHGGVIDALKSTFRGGASVKTFLGAGKLVWHTLEHSMKEFSKMGELRMAKNMAAHLPFIGGTGTEFYTEMEAAVLGEKKKLTKALFDRIDSLPGKNKGRLIKHILFSKHSQDWELDAAAQAAVAGYGRLYFDDEMRKYEGTFFWIKRLGLLQTEKDRKKFEEKMRLFDQANMVAPEEEILWECLKSKHGDDILNATNWVAFRNTMKEGAKKHWERGEDFTGVLYDPDAVNDYCFDKMKGGEHMQTMAGIERVMKLRGTQRQVNEIAFLSVFGGVAQRMPPDYRSRLESMHSDGKRGYVCPPLFFIGPSDQSLFHDISIAAADRIVQREKDGPREKEAQAFAKDIRDLSASVRKKSILGDEEFDKLRNYWKIFGEDMCDIMWAMKNDRHIFLNQDNEKYSKYWGRLSEKMDDEQALRGEGSQEWFWDGRLKEWSSMVVNLELNFLRDAASNLNKIGTNHGLSIFEKAFRSFDELRADHMDSQGANPKYKPNDPRYLSEKDFEAVFRRMYAQLKDPLMRIISFAKRHDEEALVKIRGMLAHLGYSPAAQPFDTDWFAGNGMADFSNYATETFRHLKGGVQLSVPAATAGVVSGTRSGVNDLFMASSQPGKKKRRKDDLYEDEEAA